MKLKCTSSTSLAALQATGGTCDASLKATCNDHGTIEGSDLACLPVSCAPLSDSAFTLLTTGSSGWSPTGRLLSGESVTVSCSDGYRALAGIDHSSCTDPDQFTASCTPGTCDYDSGGTRCVQVACPLHLQVFTSPSPDTCDLGIICSNKTHTLAYCIPTSSIHITLDTCDHPLALLRYSHHPLHL